MGGDLEPTIAESIWAKTVGQEVLRFIKNRGEDINQKVHGEAFVLLGQIRAILNDNTLDDPECFHRIDAIVDAFSNAGISTARHDW